MAKKKACRKCKILFEDNACPICKSDSFSTSWQGRVYVNDVSRSMIGEKIGLKVKGEYAIKVR